MDFGGNGGDGSPSGFSNGSQYKATAISSKSPMKVAAETGRVSVGGSYSPDESGTGPSSNATSKSAMISSKRAGKSAMGKMAYGGKARGRLSSKSI